MILKQALAVLAIATLILSCDKEEDLIKEKYQGDWIYSYKVDDKLIKATCIASRTFSRTFAAKVEKESITMTITLYPDSTTCEGEQKIVATSSAEMEDAGSDDGQQVLKMKSSSDKVTVTGAKSVEYLNNESSCGHSDWEETSYDQNSDHLKDCTSSNSGTVVSAPDTEEDINVKRIRLKEAFGGLSIADKKESQDDAEYENSESFFLKN